MENNAEQVPAGAAVAARTDGASEQGLLVMVGVIVLLGLAGILAISGL
jgi:hypothetical protein